MNYLKFVYVLLATVATLSTSAFCVVEIKASQVSFTSDRLFFRSLDSSHVDELVALYTNPTVMEKFVEGKAFDPTRAQETAMDMISQWEKGDLLGSFAVYSLSDTSRILGVLLLDPGRTPHEIEIGYLLFPECWGKGYGFEAAKAFIDEYLPFVNKIAAEAGGAAQSTMRPITEIFGTAHPQNRASVRILDKLGLQAEPTLQAHATEADSTILSQLHSLPEEVFYQFTDEQKVKRVLGVRFGNPRYFMLLKI